MFVPEVFEMLQNSFLQHHSKFNFPNKQLEHSSPKFQAAIGQFTIALNDKIRSSVQDQLKQIEEAYTKDVRRISKKLGETILMNMILSFSLGVSVLVNIAMFIF